MITSSGLPPAPAPLPVLSSSGPSSVFIGSPPASVSSDPVRLTSGHDARPTQVEARNNFRVNIAPEGPAAAASAASALKSFKKIEGAISGPNPGTDTDDFPIISLIDEPGTSFYDTVLQNIGHSSSFVSQPVEDNFISSPSLSPPSEDFRSSSSLINSFASSFSSNPNSFNANQNGLNSNPYYAPEEFTYNQDPILIDHSDSAESSFRELDQDLNDDRGEVSEDKSAGYNTEEYEESINEIEGDVNDDAVEQIKPTLLPTFLEEIEQISKKTEKSSRSLFPKDVFRKRAKSRDYTNLVKTIEYKPKEIIKKEKNNASSLVSSLPVPALECPELASTGFCSLTPDYPRSLVTRLMEECGTEALVTAWDALIPLDLDSLGDNSASVISSQKDRDRPWSWTVSAYSKSQVCGSDLAFLQPSYARDTRGSLAREVSQPLMLFLPRSRCDHCPGRRCSPARVGGHVPQSGFRVSGSGHVRPPSPGHRGTEVAVCPEIHSPVSPGHPPHLRHPLPRHHRRQVPLRLCLPRTDKPD